MINPFAPGAGDVLAKGSHLPRDVIESIIRSPLHAQKVFAEQWDVIKDHWLELAHTMAALIAAEIGVAILAAIPDPTMGTKIAAFALQALLIAFAVHATYTAGSLAIAHGNAWWAKVNAAKGDGRTIDAAALDFVRMFFALVQAIGGVLGIRAAARARGSSTHEPPSHSHTKNGTTESTSSTKPKTTRLQSPESSSTNTRGGAGTAIAHEGAGTSSSNKGHGHARKAPVNAAMEFRIERSHLRVKTHRSSMEWIVEVEAPLPEGRRSVGTGFVELDPHGAALGGPEFVIRKNVTVGGTEGKVQIYEAGHKVSLTDIVLDEAIAAFRKEFGHVPETLPGSLAWENKLNFQRAYARAIQEGMTHDAASQSAIREISFGRSRAARVREILGQRDQVRRHRSWSDARREKGTDLDRNQRTQESVMQTTDEHDIRAILGRDLDESEIANSESLDTITAAVEAVTAKLARRDVILACKYLRERVPGSRISAVKVTVEAIMERDARRR